MVLKKMKFSKEDNEIRLGENTNKMSMNIQKTRLIPNNQPAILNPTRAGIVHYLKILTFLKRKEILGKASVYPIIGFDFFPALFTTVFGFNNRAASQIDFFENEVRKQGLNPKNWTEKLRKNLNYVSVTDSKNTQALENELKKRGFFELLGRKSLILKGTLVDLFEKEFDPDTERYYPCENPIERARAWLAGILTSFNPGDNIIAFDKDIQMFPHEGCTRVNLDDFPIKTDLSESEFYVDTGKTAITRLYLPSKFQVYKMGGD